MVDQSQPGLFVDSSRDTFDTTTAGKATVCFSSQQTNTSTHNRRVNKNTPNIRLSCTDNKVSLSSRFSVLLSNSPDRKPTNPMNCIFHNLAMPFQLPQPFPQPLSPNSSLSQSFPKSPAPIRCGATWPC